MQDVRRLTALILAYDFPPYVSVGGLRPYSWFRYLARFGVDPIVVTRQWENRFGDERDYVAPGAVPHEVVEETISGTIVRAPHRPHLGNRILLNYGNTRNVLLRRAITAAYELGQFYANVGPKAAVYRAARNLLSRRRVDVILATGEPFVLFRYATKLSREFGIPWVADFRDAWSQNKGRAGFRLSRRWDEALERRYTASARLITTVSGLLARMLATVHEGKTVEIVMNGFDPESVESARSTPQARDRFTIGFAGMIYGWHPVETVFSVLNHVSAVAPFELSLVGINDRVGIERLLTSKFSNLAKKTTFVGRLPNDLAARELAKANVLLMFNNYAYLGTKIFDYLALKRHVLLCYANDPDANRLRVAHYNLEIGDQDDDRVLETVVRETRAGTVVQDAEHLRVVLTRLIDTFRLTGAVPCESLGTEKYSRVTQTATLAALLRGVVQ